jgi:hypothetical protein
METQEYPCPKHTWFISTKCCQMGWHPSGGPSSDIEIVIKDFIDRLIERGESSVRCCRIQRIDHFNAMRSGRYLRSFHHLLTAKFDDSVDPNQWTFTVADKKRKKFNLTRPFGTRKRKVVLTKTFDEMKRLIERQKVVNFSIIKS